MWPLPRSVTIAPSAAQRPLCVRDECVRVDLQNGRGIPSGAPGAFAAVVCDLGYEPAPWSAPKARRGPRQERRLHEADEVSACTSGTEAVIIG